MIDQYGNEISWVPNFSHSTLPKYISIAKCLENDINNGILMAGCKLPPQRVIANYLGICHSTMTRAYKLCEEKGLIKGIIGKGTFVNSYAGLPQDVLTNANHSKVIEMGMVLPLYECNNLIESFLKEVYPVIDYDFILKYVPPEGHIKHRYVAAKWLKRFNVDYSPEQIMITSGSQNALSVILISLFEKGTRIIVDDYTYTGIKSLAKLLGIILVPVKSNENGIDIHDLKKTCIREKPKGIYLIPDCHNPTSVIMSRKKRMEVARIIDEYNLLLIEDSPFRFSVQENMPPISHFVSDSSIYIAGTSKSLSPTFRISYIASPRKYIKQLIRGINNLIWMASPINSEIITQLLSSSKYDQIVTAKRLIIRERNKLVDNILCDYTLIPNETSLFRYLILPQSISDKDIELACLVKGVQVFSSKRFSVSTHPHKNGIRLSISGPQNIEELRKGLLIIRDVLKLSEMAINPII